MRFTQAAVANLKPPAGKADHVVYDDAMPGFGIRFRNGGPGTFFIQYKIGQKHGRLSLGKVAKITLDAAKIAAKKEFAAIAEKRDPAIERAKAVAKVSGSIEPLIDDFLDYLGRNDRSQSYLAENKRSLKRYFKPLHRFSPTTSTGPWSQRNCPGSEPSAVPSPPTAAGRICPSSSIGPSQRV